MLMWMLRGCGPSALGGMPPVRRLFQEDSGKSQPTLVRPLLNLSRAQIMQYLRAEGLKYRQDATNRDTRYLRNWVRSDLLPALVERTDDGLTERLARLSGLLQSDQWLLDRYVATASASAIADGVLSCPAFLRLEVRLRSRVLRRWLQSHLGNLRGVGFQHVESMMRLTMADRPSGYVSLPGGWTAVKDYDRLHLVCGLEDQAPTAYESALPLEGEVRIAELGVTVRAWCSNPAEALHPENMHRAIFDRDALKGTRMLRSRRPGDRFQPLGMAGHKKVKDLLIEKKAPRRLRDRLPLVLVGGEVLWVPGYGRSGAAKVDFATREVWNLEMSAIDSRRTGSYSSY
jgi:tRNA(Ile)-lysidine synthase